MAGRSAGPLLHQRQCEFLEYPLYHFDGQEQLRHLDMLLGLKKLRAIQWTPVAAQPPTVAFLPQLKKIQAAGKSLLLLPQKDRNILRECAKTQLEWANSPQNQALLCEWPRHNACLPGRPLLHLEVGTFETEILEPRLRLRRPHPTHLLAAGTMARILSGRMIICDDYVNPVQPPLPNLGCHTNLR